MGGSGEREPHPAVRQGAFATTHWSVVLQAGGGKSAQAAAALEELRLHLLPWKR